MRLYEAIPHPHIAQRKPPKPVAEHHTGTNARLAVMITTAVGTMWCAYVFAFIAIVALPSALGWDVLGNRTLLIVQWISQTFIQLVLLSVIMVGQNVLARASDERADATYKDASAVLDLALKIEEHLQAQDKAIADLLAKAK